MVLHYKMPELAFERKYRVSESPEKEGKLFLFPTKLEDDMRRAYRNSLNRLPDWYNKADTAYIPAAMLAVRELMQNHKYQESMVSGDIGLRATVEAFTENDLLARMIEEEAGAYSAICESGYAGLVAHAINKMEGYPAVERLRDEHSNGSYRADALEIIPEFVFHSTFPAFLKEARNEYCGSLCSRTLQCAGVTDLHREKANKTLYFG